MTGNQRLKDFGIIAILRGIPSEKILSVVQVLFESGIRAVECTVEHITVDCNRLLQQNIKLLDTNFGSKMLIGAGTVLSEKQVELAIDSGAKMIISPNIDEGVINRTKHLGAISIPGAMTPTEVVNAYNLGADYIKLFPAGLLGAKYIRALMAPLAHVPLIAVGSISAEVIPEFKKNGILCFGVGDPLLPQEAIAVGNYDEIKRLATKFIDAFNCC